MSDALHAKTALDVQGAYIDAMLPRERHWKEKARRFTARKLAQTVGTIAELIHPSVSIEVGAFEASFSKRIKGALSETRVVAFEANPDVYEAKRHEVVAAGVEYENVCIAAGTGKQKLRMPLDGEKKCLTMGSIMSDNERSAFKTYEVDSISLDAFLGKATEEPNVLWVDVEGAVDQVLAGGSKTLRSCMLFFVELEKSERWGGQHLDGDVVLALSDYGLWPVLRDTQRHYQYNALFLRDSAMEHPGVKQSLFRFVRQISTELTRLRIDEASATPVSHSNVID